MAITDYHKAIFTFLEKYRSEHPEFTYLLRKRSLPQRPKSLYLFTGAEDYIFVGLYAPQNINNKTRSIGFSCTYDSETDTLKKCSLEIAFNHPNLYAQQDIYWEILERIGKEKFVQIGTGKFQLRYDSPEWKKSLLQYLEYHKPLIDKVIKQNNAAGTFFISKQELEDDIAALKSQVTFKSNDIQTIEITAQNMPGIDNRYSKNIILYGPPGTGKTYETIDLAVDIVDGKKDPDHKINKVRFDILRKQGQIEFVTFHQNYTYEDFVMGLKPDVDGGDLKFQRSYGVFYRMAKKAQDNYEVGRRLIDPAKFEDIFEKFVEPLKNNEEITLPMSAGYNMHIRNIVGNQNLEFYTDMSPTVETKIFNGTLKKCFLTSSIPTHSHRAYYKPVLTKMWEMADLSQKPLPVKNYVLIIDEINRANMSRVFGELITLLEDDKRLGGANELIVTLPSGEPEPFAVPPNLYLIGTMNTADKSLALLDIALRRRFEFRYKKPDAQLLGNLATMLNTMNQAIRDENKPADFLIGHAYFINKKDEELPEVFNNRVIPLLLEYFNGNAGTVVKILDKAGVKVQQDSITNQLMVTNVG